VWIGLLAPALASTAQNAAAEEASSSPPSSSAVVTAPARWVLGAGVGMAVALNESERSTSYDTVEVSSLLFTELVLEPMVLVAPSVSVGIRGGWGFEIGSRALASWDGESTEQAQHVWQLAPAARYQEQPGRGWYLAGNVGIAGITDSIGDRSVTQVAPLLSAALGIDVLVVAPLSLGLELRASHAMFSEQGSRIVRSAPEQGGGYYRYGPTGWLGLSLLGRFLL
jgi:hypothetical protein